MTRGPDWQSTDPQEPHAIDAAIAPGTVLGDRYAVRCQIGRGGMGSVWRVHDQRTGEDVALKVLVPGAGADALGRFRREVTLARRIAHPNVCRMFDLGVADGLHVLTMELVEGTSLRGRLAQGALPWPTACRLIDDLLGGLAAVHASGVVHRDVKPENILIAADGRAVIVDFGLAWAPTAQFATTPDVGTPQYMAPEQLSGKAVDPRSDVFAAGLLIHEILDGRSPFEGATAALVASAILRDLPRPLEGKQVPTDVRTAVARVLSRALGRDRATRQADAGALRSEWLAATAGPPATRSGRRIVGSIGFAVAAAAAILGFTRYHRLPPEPATTQVEAPPGNTAGDRAREPATVGPTPARSVEVANDRPDNPITAQSDVVVRTRPQPPRNQDDGALTFSAVTLQDRGVKPSAAIVNPHDRATLPDAIVRSKDRATPSDAVTESHDDRAKPSDASVKSQDGTVKASEAIVTSRDRARSSDASVKSQHDRAKRSSGNVKSQSDRAKPSDVIARSQDDPAKPSDVIARSQDDRAKPSDASVKSQDDRAKPSDASGKSQDDSAGPSDASVKSQDRAEPSSDKVKPRDGVNPHHSPAKVHDRIVNPFKR